MRYVTCEKKTSSSGILDKRRETSTANHESTINVDSVSMTYLENKLNTKSIVLREVEFFSII